MEQEKSFFRTVCNLAVPVALQSMLQASFSIIDQIMIGQLGSVSVAGVGLAGKFSSVFSVLASAIGAVAGIMISQYMGQKNKQEVRRSFFINLIIAIGLAGIFTVLCIAFPRQIMGLYTQDEATLLTAAGYLTILAGTFLPIAAATLLSTLFRCMEKASLPLYASILAAFLNTGLNYILIFGKLGIAPMGAEGAAIATTVSQAANFLLMLLLLLKYRECLQKETGREHDHTRFDWMQYASMCGLSQAAGVLIGKTLGKAEYERAYQDAKKLIFYGFAGSLLLSVFIVLTRSYYVALYQVEESVKHLTKQILIAYAVIAPFKVQNMIVGGGIIRSGGRTKYVMLIDLIGTWLFGVPLGLLAAFVLELSIPYVYFILSLEECIRFGISLIVLKRKKWMQSLNA